MSICPICSIEFEQPKYYETKTCSAKCGSALLHQSTRVELKCPQCDQMYITRKKKPTKYCSNDCYHKTKVGKPNPGGGNQAPIVWYEKQCPSCEKDFRTKVKDQKTCSYRCAGLAARKSHICPCGKEYWNGPRMLNASKFCSDECRNKHGLTKKGFEVTAICVGCAEEFTRMSHYTSKMLYCSNKCAKKEQKKGWSKSGLLLENGDVLIFRSNYEVRFYAACLRFDISVRNYDGPDIQTSVGVYRPDFIVTQAGRELIVEVKGYMTQESATKIDDAVLQLDNFCLVDLPTLLQIEASGF